jgi:hypothetical protein
MMTPQATSGASSSAPQGAGGADGNPRKRSLHICALQTFCLTDFENPAPFSIYYCKHWEMCKMPPYLLRLSLIFLVLLSPIIVIFSVMEKEKKHQPFDAELEECIDRLLRNKMINETTILTARDICSKRIEDKHFHLGQYPDESEYRISLAAASRPSVID